MSTDGTHRNGIDVARLASAAATLRGRPELARLRLRAQATWVAGTHVRSVTQGFYSGWRRHEHRRSLVFDADHPEPLAGEDHGPLPAEYVLHGLGADLASTVAVVAAEQDVELRRIEASVEGQLDVRGLLGIDPAVRPGYEQVTVALVIGASTPDKGLERLVMEARRRSVVLDVITRTIPVHVSLVRTDPDADPHAQETFSVAPTDGGDGARRDGDGDHPPRRAAPETARVRSAPGPRQPS